MFRLCLQGTFRTVKQLQCASEPVTKQNFQIQLLSISIFIECYSTCLVVNIRYFKNLFKHSPCFFARKISFQELLLSSWFPCALLVTDEKDSSESLWPCITKWTLMELNLLTTLMNVFHGFFLLECSNDFKRIMQIWACAVKLFEDVQKICWPSATQLSISNSNLID